MIRYIPEFILQMQAQQKLSGSFTGFALLFDIADFTPISTEFQQYGKQGAEELSIFLDFVFKEPIRLVECYGGFVTLFAGDAFCAVFPDRNEAVSDQNRALEAGLEIIRYFRELDLYHISTGDFSLTVRQSVSYGEIFWQIYANDLQNEYVFYGQPLKALVELSEQKQEIIFSAEAVAQIGADGFIPSQPQGFLPSASWLENKLKLPVQGSSDQPQTSDSLDYLPALALFLNPKYHGESFQPEIRSAAFCFANLEGIPTAEREVAVTLLQVLADKYGGFINKYDATDKGLVALILFGIPRSEDRTLERICNFALETVEDIPQLSLGISCGSVIAAFAGSGKVREYTALGSPVNLASRLMSKARPGEVLADSYLWQELHSAFDFAYLGSLNLKGIAQPIRYYRLKRPVQIQAQEASPFVGRAAEIAEIRAQIDQALVSSENVIIYVNGDAGIGKSRLANEALAPYGKPDSGPGQACYRYQLNCDLILKKSLEAIKQIVRAHFYYNPVMPEAAGIAMFRALWSQICPQDAEMQRIESIIASLLGYDWEGSIWSILPAEQRPAQLKAAWVYFIRKLAQNKAVLIHLDDGQWLDEQSRDYFQALSAAEIGPLIIVCPCRFQSDGSKVELGLPKHRRFDLDLDSLDADGSRALTKSIMRLAEVPEETCELIFARSMGNPLFIEQLVSYLLETGSLNDKGVIVKELGHISTFSISDIISSRIDRLSQSVKDCLYGASVLGLEFDVSILSQMLNADLKTELETGKDNLIWKELRELRYIFSHILIKDISYQSMLSTKLKHLHQLAGEAMEIVYQDRLQENAEEIALHFDRAGMAEQAASYYDQAGCWSHQNYDFAKASHYLGKALQIRESVLGAEHPDTADSLHNLANLYQAQGQYAKAEPLYLQALQIREQVLGREHPDTATTLNNLAVFYQAQGRYDKAEPLHLRTLKIKEQILGAEHPNTAYSLGNLANLYWAQGRYAEAEPLLLKAHRIIEQALGAEHPDTAVSLHHLADLYKAQNKYAQAEPLYLQALQITQQTLGAEHPDLATTLNNLAHLYKAQGKYSEAETIYLQALKINEQVLGAQHPDTATSLGSLAGLYYAQGHYDQAEPLFLRALQIREDVLGEGYLETAISLNNLATVYKAQGKYAETEPLFLKALQICDALLGPQHPNTIITLNNLIESYEKMGNLEQTAYYKAMLPKEEALTD
ncbi:MAG: tetratricopeptide repeat protein [Candidatus Cloacimonetes bacterium]|nr:tetratricopeptide repeat protein [Candidatus Cloacimonadota bacterium]